MDLKFVCVFVESSSHVNISINFLFGWLLVAFWFGLLFFFSLMLVSYKLLHYRHVVGKPGKEQRYLSLEASEVMASFNKACQISLSACFNSG